MIFVVTMLVGIDYTNTGSISSHQDEHSYQRASDSTNFVYCITCYTNESLASPSTPPISPRIFYCIEAQDGEHLIMSLMITQWRYHLSVIVRRRLFVVQ
jgi:hypothetical protein